MRHIKTQMLFVFICASLRLTSLLLRGAFLRSLLSWDLRPLFSRFRESDCYRLLLARDFLSRASAFQRAVLSLVHRLLNFFACLLPVSSHIALPSLVICMWAIIYVKLISS